ncbi:MAG: 2-hydroxychromene-2-carboxylate isomerase [Parvibaculum sp.]|nr:2-hydroxychromene-2-carboxylate isomerase [Parvibaculum sp.]|tara:strand:+ start:49 stop:642 length:594 start_codon:yes stop_codon:yes gene_type:complete
MGVVEFWFEFASTYSYPASMRVEKVAAAAGVEVIWRPFLLGPLLGKQGLTDSPFNVFEQKGRYMWRDMARICEGDGIAFNKPSIFPLNGLKAARVALLGMEEGWGPDFVRAVYRANFVDGLVISDDAVIEKLLARFGQDPAAVTQKSYAPENKDRLKAQTDRAWDMGLFGAPSFTVGDELFWGNDRMETAIEWAANH